MSANKVAALRAIFAGPLAEYQKTLDSDQDESYAYDMAFDWVQKSLSFGDYLTILEILSE